MQRHTPLSQCAEYGYEDCSTHPGNSMIKNLPVFFEFVDLKLQPQEFVGSQSGLKGQYKKKHGSAAEVGWASQGVNSCDG